MILPFFPVIRVYKEGESSPISATANANNNIFRGVSIRERVYGSWIGILAQEVYEFQYKWARGGIVVNLVPSLHRELELRGHATECAAYKLLDGATDAQFEGYKRGEAKSLVTYSQFRGWTVDQALSEMEKRIPAQMAWVEKNKGFFVKWREKHINGV